MVPAHGESLMDNGTGGDTGRGRVCGFRALVSRKNWSRTRGSNVQVSRTTIARDLQGNGLFASDEGLRLRGHSSVFTPHQCGAGPAVITLTGVVTTTSCSYAVGGAHPDQDEIDSSFRGVNAE